jgi:NAD/NADP transhydrogenase beta subunit
MNTSDLTMLSKVAMGLAIAGFFVSFTTLSTSNSNGVLTCDFMDYGKLVLGGLTVLVGGLGEATALRLAETRMPNMLVSGGASLVGVLHILMGLGIVGGPC